MYVNINKSILIIGNSYNNSNMVQSILWPQLNDWYLVKNYGEDSICD